jgi:hypothetical protein
MRDKSLTNEFAGATADTKLTFQMEREIGATSSYVTKKEGRSRGLAIQHFGGRGGLGRIGQRDAKGVK